ncbi:hypothetical protein BCU78_24885 [Vibrio lentus]|nr:hypothetical protein BCU78_24885 [Vibrio lentus]
MQSCTISMLFPIEKIPYYESFHLQYSLATSSNFILFELMEKASEEEVFELFESFHGNLDDYKRAQMLMMGAHMSMTCPQAKESRGLLLDKFFISMAKRKTKPKELLANFLNAKEFILIYAIFENVLKGEFLRLGILAEGKFMREKDLFKFLNDKLSKQDMMDDFVKCLSQRSPIKDFETLTTFWKFFTHIRHLYTHSGGMVTAKWIATYINLKTNLEDKVYLFDDLFLKQRLNSAIDGFEPEVGQIFNANDHFSNIFRNLIVYIMEALYLSEIKAVKKLA